MTHFPNETVTAHAFPNYPDIETFIETLGTVPELGEQRARDIQNIVNSLDRLQPEKPAPRILVDPGLAGTNVGGYFDPDKPDCIFINPIIALTAPADVVAHVIQHETYHYAGLMDESVVDYLTVLKRRDAGESQIQTGYEQLVGEFSDQIEIYKASELANLIVADNPASTLVNLTSALLLDEQKLAKIPDNLNRYGEISAIIQSKWDLLNRLLPRLMHEVFGYGEFNEGVPYSPEAAIFLAQQLTLNLAARLGEVES
ncbi:MAG: hypothetical protein JNK26_01730 [Candidatus Doudnabacteria bacterium]|nr:hypothetical protein [Candidatus Doudnabacteria bacterium]